MQKVKLNRYLICLIIVAFLFLNPTSVILSNETEKSQSQHTPEMRGYDYNLKQLLEEAERNLKEVDKKLKEEEIKRLNEEREIQIRAHFEKGNQFYRERKLKEAKQEWQKALEISKDSKMRDYIKETEKRAREEELTRRKEEQKRQRQLVAEQREKKRLEQEKQKQLELAKREQERKQKDEQARLAKEQKEQERIKKQKELKRQKRFDAESKEKELKLNEQAKAIYNEAVSLYRSKNYEQAQVKFEQTAQIVPHYSRTDYYLRRISQDIQREQERKQREEELARQKEQQEKQKRLAAEQREKKRLEQEKQKQLVAKQKEKERRLNEQAKAIYNEAVSLYRARNYKQARVKFGQVIKLVPSYARTDNYLKRITQDIKRAKERQELERKRQQERLKREQKLKQGAEAREKERLEREKQKQLELEKKEQERKQREEESARKKEEQKRQRQLVAEQREKKRLEWEKQEELQRQKRLGNERVKKSRDLQAVKETVKEPQKKLSIKLEVLTYKTEKECLDILNKDPNNKEAFNDLINLYLLKDELLNKAKELYKRRNYQKAIQEYNKVLLIQPENEQARMGIKQAQSRIK